MKVCVVIPTYNNSSTIGQVIGSALACCPEVIVVCDGADKATVDAVEEFRGRIDIISYPVNHGKGYALKTALRHAKKRGFDYAVTMDSDGQHFADDIPLFLNAISAHSGPLYVGSRPLDAENMPSGSSFANRFSNFWFTVQTGLKLPDTQTGFRAYPLSGCVMPFSNRYEAELEMLVRSAWKGVKIVPVPIKVYYAPSCQRVSHFRKGRDFLRISLMNTVLVLLSLVYGWPAILFHKLYGGGR